jgi:hypothetical protein
MKQVSEVRHTNRYLCCDHLWEFGACDAKRNGTYVDTCELCGAKAERDARTGKIVAYETNDIQNEFEEWK